jgi:transposase
VARQKLESLPLDPRANPRWRELLKLLDQVDPSIEELDRAVISEAESRTAAVCLMQQAGVGPVTALAFVSTVGRVSRFANSKRLASYLGPNPSEESSGGRQRLGASASKALR